MLFVSPDYRAKTSWMGPWAEADLLQIMGVLKSRFRIGKVILCGEHAVVYGRPAIAVPVTEVQARATVEPARDRRGVVIDAPDLNRRLAVREAEPAAGTGPEPDDESAAGSPAEALGEVEAVAPEPRSTLDAEPAGDLATALLQAAVLTLVAVVVGRIRGALR